MNNIYDKFYVVLHKNKQRRRKMFSLLLVLSLFTSTGVVWALRDVGITMVNDAVLICGLDTHTHSEDCYSAEGELVCGLQEHQHSDDCWAETVKVEEAVTFDNRNVQILDGATETYDTIDNEEYGIFFTLFDYSVLNNENKGEGTAYNNKSGDHGISHTGINTEMYAGEGDSGIYFFPYGTPAEKGNPRYNSDGTQETTEVSSQTLDCYEAGEPGKNNYAGDYTDGTKQDHDHWSLQSGNRAVQEIVKPTLEESNHASGKYPVVIDNSKNTTQNLVYLFSNDPLPPAGQGEQFKWVYEGVNHLLRKRPENDNLYFDSNETYAELQNNDRGLSNHYDFKLYKSFDIENDDHNGDNFKIGFFPFDPYDPDHKDPNFNSTDYHYNHHFGMTMNTTFLMKPRQTVHNEPIQFNYSGDDDMWVFINDHLILDLGGIHEPAAGMIDFTNGLVWVQDEADNPPTNGAILGRDIKSHVEDLLRRNRLLANDRNLSDDEWKLLKPKYGARTQTNDGSQATFDITHWIVKSIIDVDTSYNWYNFLHGSDDSTERFELKMFYLERGGCFSNLSMEMNLPTVKPLVVRKNVDYGQLDGTDYADEYKNKQYKFKLWVSETGDPADAKIYTGGNGCDDKGVYTVSDGDRIIENLNPEWLVYVEEVDVDLSVFGSVNVGDQPAVSGSNGSFKSIPKKVGEQSTYTFTNNIRETVDTLKVEKEWKDGIEPDNHAPVYFKIYQTVTDGTTTETKPFPIEKDGTITLTQELNSANGWEATYSGLPFKYGNKTYSYEVVESFVNTQYNKPAYEWNGNKVKIINSKKESNAEIHVQKEWKNTPGDKLLPVDLELRRKYTESIVNPVTVTVKMVDHNDENIAPLQTLQAYAGGELEFTITPPANGTPTIDTGGATLKLAYDGKTSDIYEVSNIPESNTEIVFKYNDLAISDSADDSGSTDTQHTYVLYNGFESSSDLNWNAYSANTQISNGDKHSGNNAMNATNIEDSYQGVGIQLKDLGLENDETYTFIVYANYDKDKTPNSALPLSFVLKENNKDTGTNSAYDYHADPKVNGWTKMCFYYKASDWSNCYIKVEACPTQSGDTRANVNFYLDDFAIVKGNHVNDIKVENGKVYVGSTEYVAPSASSSNQPAASTLPKPESQTKVVEHKGFGPNSSNGWVSWNGDATKIEEKSDAGKYILIDEGSRHVERIQIAKKLYGVWNENGVEQTYNVIQPGKKYRFTGQFSLSESIAVDIKYQLHYQLNGGWNYDNPQANDAQVTLKLGSGDWNADPVSFEFEVPNGVEIVNLVAQTESTYTKNDTNAYVPFRFYNYTIEEIIDPAISINAGSVTKHQVPRDQWNDDPKFTPIGFTLDASCNWEKVFGNSDNLPTSENVDGKTREYVYYVVERKVDNNGNKIIIDDRSFPSGQYPTDGTFNDYAVKYLNNNGVDSNTEDNPIRIQNTYIWYQLPATGGMGVHRVYIAGGGLIAAGIFGLIRLRKREGRRK